MSLFSRIITGVLVALATVAGAHADLAIRALNADVSLVTEAENGQTAQAVQADGKLLIAGWLESTDSAWLNTLRRYTPDGAADPTFDASALQARWIDKLVALPGGKTLVVGRLGPNPNAAIDNDDADDDEDDDDDDETFVPDPEAVVRLNADGSRDPAFQPPSLALIWITAVDALSDGGLLLSGFHTEETQNEAMAPFSLVRLTADGQVDASFHGDFAAGVYVSSVQVQSDGRILIIADTEVGDGLFQSTLFRLNADGSPDAGFHSGLAPGPRIAAVASLNDGRLLVATTSDDGSGTITRLNGDGSVDGSFAPRSAAAVRELSVLEGGSVLALGSDANLHSDLELIDPPGLTKTLSDPASSDRFDTIAPLAGGGFAAGLATTAADGTESGVLAIFDAAGAALSRTPLDADSYAAMLLPRPTGGLYVIASSVPYLSWAPPPLAVTTFSPPPAPGVSIKAGPTVRVDVLRSAGYAGATKKAKFLLTRSGDLSKDLKVTYRVRGTAVSGRDYLPLRGQKIIKAGRATAKIKVRPMGERYDGVQSGEASVKLTLVEKRAYSVGSPSVAKVHLLDQRGAKEKP